MIIQKPYVLFQIGKTSSGKTEHIKQHILPNVDRALVLDFSDEYRLPVLIPYIEPDNHFLTKPIAGKYRIVLNGLSIQQIEYVLEYFSKTFYKGTLIIESQYFIYSRKTIEIIRLLIQHHRSYKQNIIINLQSINLFFNLNDLSSYGNINYINLFECWDSINTKNPAHLYFKDMLTGAFKSLKTYRNVFIDVHQKTTLCGECRGVMQDQLIK